MDWYVHVRDMNKNSDIYCGRNRSGAVSKPPARGWLGNPIKKQDGCPQCQDVHIGSGSTLSCFEEYLQECLEKTTFQNHFDRRASQIIGGDYRLACFCKGPSNCHTSIIYKYMRLRTEAIV